MNARLNDGKLWGTGQSGRRKHKLPVRQPPAEGLGVSRVCVWNIARLRGMYVGQAFVFLPTEVVKLRYKQAHPARRQPQLPA